VNIVDSLTFGEVEKSRTLDPSFRRWGGLRWGGRFFTPGLGEDECEHPGRGRRAPDHLLRCHGFVPDKFSGHVAGYHCGRAGQRRY